MDSMTQLKKLNVVVREVSDMFNIKKITGLKAFSVELNDPSTDDNILDESRGFSMAPQVILDKLKLTNVAYIDEVAGLRNTKELHFKVLDANHALYTIDFEMFRHMTNLQKLRIDSWLLSCDEELAPLTNLISLIVKGTASITGDYKYIFAAAPNLKQLYIQVKDKERTYDFRDLELLKHLDNFKIYGILPDNEEILQRLKEKNLRILGLDATNFTQQHFDILGNFDSVTNLSVTNINIRNNPMDLTQIFSLPNLEILYLQFLGAVAREDYDKWMAAAFNTKLSLFINRNEYARVSAWQKIFQGNQWIWIRLSDLERVRSPVIEEISAFSL